MCPVTEGGLRTKRRGVRQGRRRSHNTPIANNREAKLRALPIQTCSPYDNTIVAEGVCVCVYCCVLSVGWDGMGWSGHLGFLQRVKQTVRGRFTSQLGQTDNIDRVCHNTRQTEPKFPTHQNEGFSDSLFQQMKKICPYDFLIIRCVSFVKNISKHFQIQICIKYLLFPGVVQIQTKEILISLVQNPIFVRWQTVC